MPLEIELLSDREASEIWHARSKRAADFNDYVTFVNARDVGKAFRVKVPQTDQNGDEAKKIRYNFNEAAKERTKFIDIPDAAAKPENAVAEPFEKKEGGWAVEVSAPVILRWKVNSHTEKKNVQANGKKAEVEVRMIDSVEAIIVATDTVKKRGTRPSYETIDAARVTVDATNAKKGKTDDGRDAKLSKGGKWRAVKPAAPAAPANGTSNGTVAESGTDGRSAASEGAREPVAATA